LKLLKIKTNNSLLSIYVFIVVIVFIINPLSYSQTRVDSLEFLGRYINANLFNTMFDKQLNTFHLYSQFQLYGNFENTIIRMNENFTSTFIRNETKNTRDEQHFNLNAKYLFHKDLSFGISGSSSLLSDNRSLGINESSVNFAAVYSELKQIDNIRLNPFAGYSSNQQIGVTDNGALYGVEGILDKLTFSDLSISSQLRFRNEDIIPRRNLIRFYDLSVGNNFNRNVSNTIRTFFSQKKIIFKAELKLRIRFLIDFHTMVF